MLLVLQNPLDVLFLNIFSFQFLKLVQALGYYNNFSISLYPFPNPLYFSAILHFLNTLNTFFAKKSAEYNPNSIT